MLLILELKRMVTREFSSLWEKTLLKLGLLQQLKAKHIQSLKGLIPQILSLLDKNFQPEVLFFQQKLEVVAAGERPMIEYEIDKGKDSHTGSS